MLTTIFGSSIQRNDENVSVTLDGKIVKVLRSRHYCHVLQDLAQVGLLGVGIATEI